MSKEFLEENYDDNEVEYDINFSEPEKFLMKLVLMQNTMVMLTDTSKDEKTKNYLGELGAMVADEINETPAGEDILLPIEGLMLVYHALAAAANVMPTSHVKNQFSQILRLNGIKADAAGVDDFFNKAKLMSEEKIKFIHEKHGHSPDVKSMIKTVAKIWRDVAKNRRYYWQNN